jgi:hypothetical protein
MPSESDTTNDADFLAACSGVVVVYAGREDDCCRLTPAQLARLVRLAERGARPSPEKTALSIVREV